MDLVVTLVAITSLLAAPRNARRHPKKQLVKLAKLIREFGFLVPILIDRTGRIIAGHGRVEAAKLAGLSQVPAIYVEHLSPAQIEAFALAENRISSDGSFSAEAMTLIVSDLAEIADFDLSLTALDTAELDLILVEDGHSLDADDEPEPPARSGPAISRVGDIWQIGKHRIGCLDARDPASYEALLGTERVRMSISDSPYNIKIASMVSGSGRHAEFPMASGEMTPAEFTAFLRSVSELLARYGVDGSLHYLFMDFRHLRELLDGAGPCFSQLLNMCVWVKPSGGLGSLYRSRHELVFLYKAGSAPHINNVELGKHGRSRTNVWEYAGANSFGKHRTRMLEQHPTSKPVAMIADAILDVSNRGDLVLDAFLGSGTTLVACERTGRRCRGLELDPHHVDTAVLRAERLTGTTAIHLGTGKTFADLAHARLNPGWSTAA